MAGAGPAGCAAAIAAASAGVDVLLVDKAPSFPRPKPCGDALTPRAVAAMAALGVAIPPSAHPVRGLVAWGMGDDCSRFEWPATSGLTTNSYVVSREELDHAMLMAAIQAGARVKLGQPVVGLLTERGRTAGVTNQNGDALRAPVVVDATGVSSRLAEAAGLPRITSRPMGVAVRGYMRQDGPADEEWLHSWLALNGPDGTSLPGYGWVFPMGGSLYNVGVGQLSVSPSYRQTNYRALLRSWVAGLPGNWHLDWATPQIVGAALPMGIDRAGVYRGGVLLTGDAAGLVNPFNGEGVSYAMQSGHLAGLAVASAKQAGFGTNAGEEALRNYHRAIKAVFGHYYGAGNLFTSLMGRQTVLEVCLRYGLPRPSIMRPVNKLMANLIAPKGGPIDDALLRGLLRLVPAPK